MDASDVIWQSDAVRAAINSGDRGAIVRGVRRALHLTLAQLAARSGYSISTLSRMERGLQPLTDIRVMRSLADALGIPPHVFGLADTPRPSTPRLPELMSMAMVTQAEMSTSGDIAAASGQLAEIYTLASELMVKLSHDHLASITADRALQAAYDSGDILTQATARRAWCIVLRRVGRGEIAQQLILDTATALESQLRHGPEYLSVYGSLLSTAAYTAAVDGDRDTAHTLISEALDTASRIGADGNHRFTAFGPTGVGLYRISIARVLGDSGTAIEVARQINPMAIPLVERRARYWSDVARSFHQWGKHEQCFQALLAAEHASPDEVRYRKPIHQITTGLLHHPTAHALPGLRAFAQRTGMSV